ncbi:hypothetical protein [Methanosarcina lacustris]|nr:hypothetical protein [Methanosarcina lacustris]
MPTPYGMDHFIGEVSGNVKKGGQIHFYEKRRQNARYFSDE